VRNGSGEPETPVARFQPALSAITRVNGKSHAVPLAVRNRGERFDQRTDRNRNLRHTPLDRDHGLPVRVEQKVGDGAVRRHGSLMQPVLRVRCENGHGQDDREPVRDRAIESMPYRWHAWWGML
jgi:hypothetical protein